MVEGSRANILFVLKTLETYTDRDHYLSQQEICHKIQKDYGVEIERKSVGRCIEILLELDYDIVKGKHRGFALISRNFDESEVKFLTDAVFSSKAIPSNQARNLMKSIANTLSIYERNEYEYIHKCVNVNRTANRDVFYNIEIIQEAIRKKKWIEYQYLTYDINGKLIPRMDGYLYHASPCYLISNNGYYYLLAFRRGRNVVLTWRIDYMTNIRIMDDREMINPRTLPEFERYKNISEYMNDHIYLFGGSVIEATIKLNGEYAIQYIKDWFGDSAKLRVEGDSLLASIKCDENALYYWALQYCDHISILEPASLRDKLRGAAKKMMEEYQ